jgi:hypothetical protein
MDLYKLINSHNWNGLKHALRPINGREGGVVVHLHLPPRPPPPKITLRHIRVDACLHGELVVEAELGGRRYGHVCLCEKLHVGSAMPLDLVDEILVEAFLRIRPHDPRKVDEDGVCLLPHEHGNHLIDHFVCFRRLVQGHEAVRGQGFLRSRKDGLGDLLHFNRLGFISVIRRLCVLKHEFGQQVFPGHSVSLSQRRTYVLSR